MKINNKDPRIEQLYNEIFFAYSVKEKLDQVIEEEIETQENIFQNTTELIFHIRKLIHIIDTHLKWEYHQGVKKLENDFDQGNYSRLKKRIEESAKAVAALTPLIKYIYGSTVQKNNWGLVTYIDRFCRRLYPKSRIIIRPRWEYNYTFFSITEKFFEISNNAYLSDSSLRFALKTQIDNAPYFFSLAYPPTAAQNVLQLALWAHEIAHFVDNLEGFYSVTNGTGEVSVDRYIGTLSTILVQKYLQSNSFQMDEATYESIISLLGVSRDSPEFSETYNTLVNEPLAAMIEASTRELFADQLSIRLLGPAAIFAFSDFVYPISLGLDSIHDPSYPSLRLRLQVMLDTYKRWNSSDPDWVQVLPSRIRDTFEAELEHIQAMVKSPHENISFLGTYSSKKQELSEVLYKVLFDITKAFVNTLSQNIDELVNRHDGIFITPSDLRQFIRSPIDDLVIDLPPTVNPKVDDGKLLAVLLNTGWLYWLDKRKYNRENRVSRFGIQLEEMDAVNLLLIKAFENAEATRWFRERESYGKAETGRNLEYNSDSTLIDSQRASFPGVLSHKELISRVDENNIRVVPLLDKKHQVGSCSLDIRLGNEFIITKSPLVSKLDPVDFDIDIGQPPPQNKIYIPFGKPFILHPSQFVLGSTLEYFKIPADIMGLLIGRSSWGRLGLVIATPNKISPSFVGCLTLQLTNLGNVPIYLYPCARLGQIIFSKI